MKPNNLIEMLSRTVDRYPGKTALMWKDADVYRGISYKMLWEEIKNTAIGLAKLGVQPEDKVAILSENNPRWPVADFAISSLGAVNVPVYPTQTVEQTAFILKNAECKIAIVENEDQMNKVIQASPFIEYIIVMYPEGLYSHEKSIYFEELTTMGTEASFQEWENYWRNIPRDHLATIIHTSGTTGNPKGAMLTHGNFLANIEGVQFWVLEARADDVLLSYLPLSHVFERTAGQYMPLSVGATIAYAESLDTIVDNLLEVRPTIMTTVPRLLEKIYAKVQEEISSSSTVKRKIFNWALQIGEKRYDYLTSNTPDHLVLNQLPSSLRRKFERADRFVYQKVKEKIGGRIRGLISGGAALNPKIAKFFWSINIPVMEGYGLTETAPVISANPITRTKIGTVGKPLPNLEVKLADDGEILVRGPVVMKGYYKDEDATNLAISNGWFKTGDIGNFDEEGYLSITDRKKSIMVLSTGKNVAPQAIENAINQSKYIEQSALIGHGRKYVTALGTPCLEYIIPWAKEKGIQYNSNSELLNHAKLKELLSSDINHNTKEFAGFEQPKKLLLFDRIWTVEREEITPSLKVKVGQLEKRYAKAIEALYSDNRGLENIIALEEEELIAIDIKTSEVK